MQSKRNVTLVVVLALVVLAAVGGWLAGTLIQSPAEAAARTAPPTPSPILVPVEKRLLTSAIVTRGTGRYGLPQGVSLAPSTAKGGAGIITTLPVQGAQVNEGDLLLTASERPVFVLQGATPVYRDLRLGMTGNDVRQLEESLARLGFDPGAVDGVFDEQTSSAVTAWYEAAGWQSVAPSTTQMAARQSLETALAEARDAQSSAEEAAAAAPLAVEAVRATADKANKIAAAAVADQTLQRAAVFAQADASAAERTAADAALAVAQATAKATQLEGEAAIQAAINHQKKMERSALRAAVTTQRLAAQLALAQQQATVYVPADELVFLPALPVRVAGLQAAIGDPAQGALLSVTNNQLAVDGALQLTEAPLVKPGMAVQIDEPDLGVVAAGIVVNVADAPGTNGVDGFHVYFETEVTESATPLDGFSLRLTIPVNSTDGMVTAVPLSAVALRSDGASTVQVERNGVLETVVVKPGLAANGFVEVTPVDGTLTAEELVLVGYERQGE
ncbi:MAG: peptidoglycan-binding domain-containing protein [Caldilineaceae bacterium]